MKLLIAIVNFRVAELTIDCLRSLESQIELSPGTHVAVSENGTGDDSAARIQHAIDINGWGEWCTLTPLDQNLGFTGGNNVLIRAALMSAEPPDYVLLLNPDTLVRPNAITTLVEFMECNSTVGIAGSRLEDPDGTPQRSAFRFHSALGELERTLKLGLISKLLTSWIVAPPVVDHAIQTDWVAGASMIIRRQVFDDVGLLDEGYFTYFDDIDFCFNAKKAGWKTWYVPNSRVVHLVGQSSGVNRTSKRLPGYLLEARRRYFLKNYGPLYAAVSDACAILGLCLHRAKAPFKEQTNASHVIGDYFRHSVFMNGFSVNTVKAPYQK